MTKAKTFFLSKETFVSPAFGSQPVAAQPKFTCALQVMVIAIGK
jgi:hypothetical protein